MPTDHKPNEDDEMQYRQELDAALDDGAARRAANEEGAFYATPANCPRCGEKATAVLGHPRADGRREAWCANAHVWLASVTLAPEPRAR